ncbi:MAG TPA: 50S ribosomal protein L10 [Blastocatellia bacterium]|nr:50S ribosomal protein L10 [Blastocatellia bacterium]HMV86288.1 50S ribosomal protein L10 [Blastocatellia bacterium]HMX29538.1 50S ribosomal protein L10 [Blastocatellia bacterium]HMY73425.1 50S ribosomal protein L10 [Blastocatellia bacterium]HMZ22055.1 50S ribosomal protein L10 [Blastocatellia bacterium]
MKTKEQKEKDIAALKEDFKKSSHALVVSFEGLPVDKDWELRRALQAAQLNYRVVKNTLGRIAVEDTPLESLKDHFKGMTAVAYSENDPVGLAKVLSKFAKDNSKLTFKAGVVEGRAINVKDIDALASMPSKEELISKLMYVLNAPAQGIAVALNGVARNLAVVVQQIAEKKGEQA